MAVSGKAYAINTTLVAGLVTLVMIWPVVACCVFVVLALVLAVNGIVLYGFSASPWELPVMIVTIYGRALSIICSYVARGRTPLFPKWTLAFELFQGLLRCLLENYGANAVNETKAAYLGRLIDRVASKAFAGTVKANGTKLERVQINNLEHIWIKPVDETKNVTADNETVTSETPEKTRIVLLYYHGGGYAIFTPSAYTELASLLRADIVQLLKDKLPSQQFSVDVLLANYRKSVTHPFPVPSQDAYLTYEYLVNHEKLSPKQIVLAGDSAGGGLTMSTMLRARDNGLPQPLAAALLHPYADLSGDDVDHPHCVLHSSFALACRNQFVKDVKDDSPAGWEDGSAVHCDLRGLPPAVILTSDFDLLRMEAQRLKAKADADGLDWTLDQHKNMPHVFMLAPPAVLPYTTVGSAHIGEFLVKHIVRMHRQHE